MLPQVHNGDVVTNWLDLRRTRRGNREQASKDLGTLTGADHEEEVMAGPVDPGSDHPVHVLLEGTQNRAKGARSHRSVARGSARNRVVQVASAPSGTAPERVAWSSRYSQPSRDCPPLTRDRTRPSVPTTTKYGKLRRP